MSPNINHGELCLKRSTSLIFSSTGFREKNRLKALFVFPERRLLILLFFLGHPKLLRLLKVLIIRLHRRLGRRFIMKLRSAFIAGLCISFPIAISFAVAITVAVSSLYLYFYRSLFYPPTFYLCGSDYYRSSAFYFFRVPLHYAPAASSLDLP